MHRVDIKRFYRAFGKKVRERRDQVELTQEALAKRVGLSRPSVANIENGNHHISLHMLHEIAAAVGASPADLLPPLTSIPGTLAEKNLREMDPGLADWIVRGTEKTERKSTSTGES